MEKEQKIVKKIVWFFILEKLLNGFFNWNERIAMQIFSRQNSLFQNTKEKIKNFFFQRGP